MNQAPDVAVIGGGVIGCSIAYHAARRGARVTLFEAEGIGTGASGAAAGMLAAQSEADDSGPFLDLLLTGRKLHGPLSGELLEETGLDVGYVGAGALHVAFDESSEEELTTKHSWQREQDLPAEWLDAMEARELEPALSQRILAGLYLPEDGQLNPPLLVRALAQAARSRGARIEEASPVTGFLTKADTVTGIRTSRETLHAGTVVLANGAYSPALARELGVDLPIHPVKGDILAVQTDPTPIKANLWGAGCYLVPKKDGRVVIGATEEPGVYDRRPTLGGVASLSGAAVMAIPELAHAPFAEAWGGLRPTTADGRPIIGPLEGWDGLLIATGHYRNGVLLAHVTGEAVAALALGEEPPVDVSPYAPGRFAARARGAG
jgi:glycine oxidase